MAKIIDDKPRPTVKDRVNAAVDGVRKGYTDSPRNRSR
jgi:hypothetical protein